MTVIPFPSDRRPTAPRCQACGAFTPDRCQWGELLLCADCSERMMTPETALPVLRAANPGAARPSRPGLTG